MALMRYSRDPGVAVPDHRVRRLQHKLVELVKLLDNTRPLTFCDTLRRMLGLKWKSDAMYQEVLCLLRSVPGPVPGPGSQFMSSHVSAYVTLNASLDFGNSVPSRDFRHQLDIPSPIQDPKPHPVFQAPFHVPSPVQRSKRRLGSFCSSGF
ncbi:hypothetical protein BG000_005543 [Podila horticola]|nr:hypothetical protein BG000_005543 [Podila horticola]